MKKILVSGCANCPYFIVWDNGEGKGFESIKHGECRHPSFRIHRDLPAAIMGKAAFLEFDVSKDDEPVSNVKASGTPPWCPLPNEGYYEPLSCNED